MKISAPTQPSLERGHLLKTRAIAHMCNKTLFKMFDSTEQELFVIHISVVVARLDL